LSDLLALVDVQANITENAFLSHFYESGFCSVRTEAVVTETNPVFAVSTRTADFASRITAADMVAAVEVVTVTNASPAAAFGRGLVPPLNLRDRFRWYYVTAELQGWLRIFAG
jgi:hypothetical protein